MMNADSLQVLSDPWDSSAPRTGGPVAWNLILVRLLSFISCSLTSECFPS